MNLYNTDEGRNVGRDVKYADTTVVLIPKIGVPWDARITVC